jgi:hypothetical protein
MKLLLLAALSVALLVFGCCGQTPLSPVPSGSGGNESVSTENVTAPVDSGNVTPQPPTGDGVIVDVGNTTGGSGTTVNPATSQQDCATLTPTCGACISKPGCGWCKTSNTCFYGDANGPKNDATCQSADWSTTEQGCQAPVGGTSCGSKTNCADCLSGSSCKWCQEGTKCADSQSSETCASGGWRTKSYMCYGGQ